MDKDVIAAKQQALHEAKKLLATPFMVEFVKELDEQAEGFVTLLCERTPNNIETFLSHFEAIGQLRGVRLAKSLIVSQLEELTEELKDI